mmetsp:Transcript_14765/g.27340  ORF Transcript_14765/g.27340 Transcript_14765/m.27340 type:complete len:119 (+) Transcript_14765:84-440(+)
MNTKVQTRFQAKAQVCGICFEQVAFQGSLDSCKHVFCFDCISNWAKTENSCPMCKLRFTQICRVLHRVDYAGESRPRRVAVQPKDQKFSYMQAELLSQLELAESLIAEELRRLMENLR